MGQQDPSDVIADRLWETGIQNGNFRGYAEG